MDIGKTAYKKNLVDQYVLEEYGKLIDELKILKKKSDIYEEVVAKCPDEFNCQLTYNFIKNPVRLPSGMIVDKNSIK